MGSVIRHMSICVEGVLTRWSDKQIKGMFKDNVTGKQLSVMEVRQYLAKCLKEGKECLPLGDPCEGFSYKTGCPGHKK